MISSDFMDDFENHTHQLTEGKKSIPVAMTALFLFLWFLGGRETSWYRMKSRNIISHGSRFHVTNLLETCNQRFE